MMSLAKGLKHGALKEFDVPEKEYLPLIGSFCANYNIIANALTSELDTEQPTETLLELIRAASISASHRKTAEWVCVPPEVVDDDENEDLTPHDLLQGLIII